MLKALSHALHVLGEVALGLLAALALGGCVLAWRLAQGPIDITPLILREHALLNAKGAHVTVGGASLAWEGFSATGQPLNIVVRDVAARAQAGGLEIGLNKASVALSISQLLLGRIAPRVIAVDGAAVTIDLRGGLFAQTAGAKTDAAPPPWLRRLGRVRLRHTALTVRGALPGTDIVSPDSGLDVARLEDGGLAGSARIELQAGAARSVLNVQAAVRDAGTQLTVASTAVSPAALAGLSPIFGPLQALDAPVRLNLQTHLGRNFELGSAELSLQGGAGMARAGFGSVAIQSLEASLSIRAAEARLDRLRVALAPISGPGVSGAPPPILIATATARRQGGRVQASFGVDIDSASMADLPWYWPEGTGGGARAWLTRNVTEGRAHDAHVSGTLEGPADFSGAQLTSLGGGLAIDNATLFWLRPVPGLEHAQARVTIEGPDALRVVVEKGGEKGLVLAPGSSIRVTGLSTRHQFGDIDVGLSGAVPDALALLNHPRLALLSRSGLDVAGATGDVSARLTLHVPLEDNMTMDDIAIGAKASLHQVHLGRIAAGRDLDHGELGLRIDGNGMAASGTGDVSGVPAELGLEMDFRAGPPAQVLQHVTASAKLSQAQMMALGAPEGAAHLLEEGEASVKLDYAGRRDGRAALQADADLTRAALKTPLGWNKPAGAAASLAGRVTLDHGRLIGVENLHAEGPGLAIVSRAQMQGGARILTLSRMDIGQTRARGVIAIPANPKAPIRLVLSGSLLDLSAQLDPAKQAAKAPPAPPNAPEADDKPSQPWTVSLKFGRVQLSRGKMLSPLTLDAESDGLRILHAQLRAGSQGEMSASIVPQPGGRHVSISATDAGVALRALDVADNIYGGRLSLDASYDDTKPSSPLAGTATLTEFNFRDAPAIGRLLQAMTLYGLADLARGPGLHFSKLVAPFRWHRRVLTLTSARAFSASLGLTAQGDLDLRRQIANITGTVVPAYFFNQLLGDLPIVGRLFSPEKGGGVFAARYSLSGPLDKPKVGVNPLAALTPGFLREGFGLLAPKAPATK